MTESTQITNQPNPENIYPIELLERANNNDFNSGKI